MNKGYLSLFLFITIFVVLGLVALSIKLPKVPFNNTQYATYCRPEVEPNGNIKAGSPEIMAPSYIHDVSKLSPEIVQDLVPYRLIKSNVPLPRTVVYNYFSLNDLKEDMVPYAIQCSKDLTRGTDGQIHHHFCQLKHKPYIINPNPSGAYQYAVLYPASWSGKPDGSGDFYAEFDIAQKQKHSLLFSEYQLIFLVHLKKDLSTYDIPGLWGDPNDDSKLVPMPWSIVDVYQRVQENNHSVPFKVLPPDVLQCVDPIDETQVYRLDDDLGQRISANKKELQLQYFLPKLFHAEFDWFFPACKPAIYLYPEKDLMVNVKVASKGIITYTDPVYNVDTGWNVFANSSGILQNLGSSSTDSLGVLTGVNGKYPYLYYESKIPDKVIKKPTSGFVVSYKELPDFYSKLLPKLGLKGKEITEFKTYWEKALPSFPYYFIGIMDQEAINQIEPLTIMPKWDTIIRVRLYFEALEKPIEVSQPEVKTPQRKGFTVVEWGGMVKTDKNHPFTCSQ